MEKGMIGKSLANCCGLWGSTAASQQRPLQRAGWEIQLILEQGFCPGAQSAAVFVVQWANAGAAPSDCSALPCLQLLKWLLGSEELCVLLPGETALGGWVGYCFFCLLLRQGGGVIAHLILAAVVEQHSVTQECLWEPAEDQSVKTIMYGVLHGSHVHESQGWELNPFSSIFHCLGASGWRRFKKRKGWAVIFQVLGGDFWQVSHIELCSNEGDFIYLFIFELSKLSMQQV